MDASSSAYKIMSYFLLDKDLAERTRWWLYKYTGSLHQVSLVITWSTLWIRPVVAANR